MSQQVASELAPTGALRAAINMGNFLLVTGKSPSGDPEGVAPDMAREIAARLGVPVRYLPYARPGELADAAGTGVWDIGLIGAEPQRAEKIAFTPAYVEIEATYLVPAGSPLKTIADVDKPGVRIAVSARSAYDLWLARNIKHAEVVRSEGGGGAAFKQFVDDKMNALAGLRPGLLSDLEKLPGARILELGEWGMRPASWEDLEIVQSWRMFLGNPRRFLRYLLSDEPGEQHEGGLDLD